MVADTQPLHLALHAGLARVPDGHGLVVGLSGGLDSSVLLHLLAHVHPRPAAADEAPDPHAVGQRLRAVHVDHGLHRHSQDWARHCQRLCAGLGVPLKVTKVAVRARGEGPEAAARRARWRAFGEAVAGDEVLVLAQHRDDQAETVLLRLLRGSGPAGLAAMPAWSRRGNGLRVWRPLLDTARASLLDHAHEHGIDWLEDPANREPRYDRNLLRHQVMPLLRRRWPRLDETLSEVARRQADAHALEQQAARRCLAAAATPDPMTLHLPALVHCDRAERWAALRLWLGEHDCARVGARFLERIDRELIAAQADAAPRLALPARHESGAATGERILRRHRDRLHLLAADRDRRLRYDLAWDGLAALAIPGAGRIWLDPRPANPLELRVRSRAGGERLQPHPQAPRRRLKHLLQEAGIPPWLRDRWPVLWYGGEPVAFADRLIAPALRDTLNAAGCRLRFQPD